MRKSQSQRSDQTSAGVYLARWRRGRGLSRKISPSARTIPMLGSIWRGLSRWCFERPKIRLGTLRPRYYRMKPRMHFICCVSTETFDHDSPCFWCFCTFQESPERARASRAHRALSFLRACARARKISLAIFRARVIFRARTIFRAIIPRARARRVPPTALPQLPQARGAAGGHGGAGGFLGGHLPRSVGPGRWFDAIAPRPCGP